MIVSEGVLISSSHNPSWQYTPRPGSYGAQCFEQELLSCLIYSRHAVVCTNPSLKPSLNSSTASLTMSKVHFAPVEVFSSLVNVT